MQIGHLIYFQFFFEISYFEDFLLNMLIRSILTKKNPFKPLVLNELYFIQKNEKDWIVGISYIYPLPVQDNKQQYN
jgi:hypothetical protein